MGSGDPKAAAVVFVKGEPIACTSPPTYNAFHVHQDTFAPQVPYSPPQIIPDVNLCVQYHALLQIKCEFILIQTGADHYKSNPCPLGYVCPMGSTQAILCPPGSFGNLTRAETVGDCHPCPAGTFNHLPAQKACFPCGSSSTSPAG